MKGKTETELRRITGGKNRKQRKEKARDAALKRWKDFAQLSPKEQEAFRLKMSEVNARSGGRPRDTGQPRCLCRVMTLARARARGRELAHKPTCTFYPDGK